VVCNSNIPGILKTGSLDQKFPLTLTESKGYIPSNNNPLLLFQPVFAHSMQIDYGKWRLDFI